MKIRIISEESPYTEFFEVRKAKLQFERFDGTMSQEVVRYSFSKWDAVGILVYHKEKDAFILVRQMRFPPLEHGLEPWRTEIVAGGLSPGEDEMEGARREVEEETGYRPVYLERIMQFYVSPGIMTERIALYYAEVDESMKTNNGGGLLHDDEDIELILVKRDEAMQWLQAQDVGDAKTIIALQWASAMNPKA